MDFQKFTILNTKDGDNGLASFEMVINLTHVVSIKPIRIVKDESLIHGYWIRLTNGKKYRAIRIPDFLERVIYPGIKPDIINIVEQEDIGNASYLTAISCMGD